jgi:hypothetical protein
VGTPLSCRGLRDRVVTDDDHVAGCPALRDARAALPPTTTRAPRPMITGPTSTMISFEEYARAGEAVTTLCHHPRRRAGAGPAPRPRGPPAMAGRRRRRAVAPLRARRDAGPGGGPRAERVVGARMAPAAHRAPFATRSRPADPRRRRQRLRPPRLRRTPGSGIPGGPRPRTALLEAPSGPRRRRRTRLCPRGRRGGPHELAHWISARFGEILVRT